MFKKILPFFKLIDILNNANSFDAPSNSGNDTIINAMNFINDNFAARLSVSDIAKKCNVSLSTLEREFYRYFKISPSEYIKKRRLANAAKMLHDGFGATVAAYSCGFSDCSKFIYYFKKEYGMTPLQYKKKTD